MDSQPMLPDVRRGKAADGNLCTACRNFQGAAGRPSSAFEQAEGGTRLRGKHLEPPTRPGVREIFWRKAERFCQPQLECRELNMHSARGPNPSVHIRILP